MNTRFIQFCLLVFFVVGVLVVATAQAPETNYYDAAWKKCDKEKACYISTVKQTDSGYYRVNYFRNNGKPQMVALYEDSRCKIGNGWATHFYANGSLQRQVRLVHGQTEGLNIGYHSNGQLADSGIYHNGQPVGTTFRWHYNGMIADSIAATANDSLRVHVSWFDDGVPAAAGREMNNRKTGTWIYYYHNGNKAAWEVYENGKKISQQQFDETGKEMVLDTTRKEQPATFKGGIEAWRRYLERSLVWPTGYTFNDMTQTTLLVEMTVGEDGKVQNLVLLNPLHPAFDKIACDVVRKSPAWQPAIQHNRPVPYRLVQNITFAFQ